jgi:hypothetical protein
MDANSTDPPEQFEHRIRWGNVALALAALAAIVAALTLPQGGSSQSIVPAPALIPTPSVSDPTAPVAQKPRRNAKKRAHRKRRKARRPRTHRSAAPPAPSPPPAAPAPAAVPVPETPDPAPAAEREFGL